MVSALNDVPKRKASLGLLKDGFPVFPAGVTAHIVAQHNVANLIIPAETIVVLNCYLNLQLLDVRVSQIQ